MIKTTIEWYTMDEKLPYDGKILSDYDDTEIVCILKFNISKDLSIEFIEQMDWIDGKVMKINDGEWVDYSEQVKYWAYVPKIGEYGIWKY